jgi:glycosyltransferase involved in cell wall biosynthesis
MNIAILIPAYNPDEKLLEIVQNLLALHTFVRLVVVNDGSTPECRDIFVRLAQYPSVDLLTHAQNQGKGSALKTGMRFLFSQPQPIAGVVTVDADGQHAIDDIVKIAALIEQYPDELILGERHFDRQVPWKSRFGNQITSVLLRWVFKINLHDSQTGLRGIPRSLIPICLGIPYDRYEYELEMLLVCKRQGISFFCVEIQTIYFNQNRATNFNPLKDSSRIYFVLFRYVITSLITTMVDYLVFFFAYPMLQQILAATLLARVVALIVNYILLRNSVFHSQKKVSNTFSRYVLLVIIFGVISANLISLLHSTLQVPIFLAKVIVEVALFFVIFWIQKSFVFYERAQK